MKTCVLLALLLSLCDAHLRAAGNMAIVARPIGHSGTPDKPAKLTATALWCGAQRVGEDVPISFGQFTRLSDNKEFEATVRDNKAHLSFGKTAPVTVAGVYRCEVRTEDEEIVSGNMFVYLPPVLRLPSNTVVKEGKKDGQPLITRVDKVSVSPGGTITLLCPAFSFPAPNVRWEKDGKPIEITDRLSFDGDSIMLAHATKQDSGVYECCADNSFPMFVKGPSMPHSLYYKQTVHVE